MGRTSTIKSHPAKDDIENAIAERVPVATIARKWSLSETSVRRHRSTAMGSVLAEMLSEEPGVPDVLARLRDLADSTRRSRQLADATGSPATKAKAQANELQVLNFLSNRLGITNLETLDFATRAQQYSNAVVRFLRDNPEHVDDIARHLLDQNESDWGEYVSGLTASIKNRTTTA